MGRTTGAAENGRRFLSEDQQLMGVIPNPINETGSDTSPINEKQGGRIAIESWESEIEEWITGRKKLKNEAGRCWHARDQRKGVSLYGKHALIIAGPH